MAALHRLHRQPPRGGVVGEAQQQLRDAAVGQRLHGALLGVQRLAEHRRTISLLQARLRHAQAHLQVAARLQGQGHLRGASSRLQFVQAQHLLPDQAVAQDASSQRVQPEPDGQLVQF